MAARAPKSPARNLFDAIVSLSDQKKLENRFAARLGKSVEDAQNKLRGLGNRINANNGLVAARSEEIIKTFCEVAVELGGDTVRPLIDQFKTMITYRSAKTGPRGTSWIRELRMGHPRLESDGKYYAYKEITKEEAQAICTELDIELPTDDSESLDAAADEAAEEVSE